MLLTGGKGNRKSRSSGEFCPWTPPRHPVVTRSSPGQHTGRVRRFCGAVLGNRDTQLGGGNVFWFSKEQSVTAYLPKIDK